MNTKQKAHKLYQDKNELKRINKILFGRSREGQTNQEGNLKTLGSRKENSYIVTDQNEILKIKKKI